ncbi:efflux RND transporter periplasmic adaptor subunit [Bythopirellula goksoeyrii]|uniref:Multidrug resistance protein MdtN n=1 Tax=Bythopirellula goksoeyrii TaxID=1400387 RepID=A0A5B9QPH7_9BACT|nr:HlyD family efflux transporter periplasmic adaptor subunit [Bythopirellula goksoeyrii]QEG35883.1 multidrug resistance protein MdtN [Bythopirellula goksoeyrii]
MTNTATQLDLSQLAVNRDQPAKSPVKFKRSWLTRYMLPGGILVGFVGLFAWATRDSFLPAQSITITPVVVSRAEIKQEGTPLFQAAGWIEPRPTPVVASSLAAGVIQEMLVIEGQHVDKGEPVAKLIDIDAKLALAEAQAQHTLQEAEVRRAEAALVAAKTNFAKPLSLRAALADAETLLSKTELALGNLPYALEAAKTRQHLAEENVRRKESAGAAVTGRILREARAELATATNTFNELVAREPMLRSQFRSLSQKRDALAENLKLLTEETRALAEAEANLAVANARADQTRLRVEIAELQLERMIVRSPIDGCVLSLDARPGQWLTGVGSSTSQGSSAVVGLYDPKYLQVRVDVRLEDVPQVQIGQPAQIETAAVASLIEGEVISVTTFADIQKNTLQVKVAVKTPPAVIKPEMLGKVTFLAPPSPIVEQEPGESPLKLFVPQSLVTTGEGGSNVWVADLTAGTAKRKAVEVGRGATDDGLVEITSGLQPTDKLIVAGRESVVEGTRVRVTSEDRTLSSGSWNTRGGQPAARTAQAPQTGS